MTYTYDPSKITEDGKDKMRFELGDTLVNGGGETCALSDEEYTSVIEDNHANGKAWVYAKLRLLEAICMKLSFQVDTKIDVLTYGFSDRSKMWRKMYDDLKKRLSVGIPSVSNSILGDHYFYSGMQENHRVK